MSKILENYQSEIKKYCAENNLSADSVLYAACSYNKEHVFILHYDDNDNDGEVHYMDSTPLPITLKIFLENGKLRFQQTEHTYRLYEREPVAEAATA